MYHLHSAKHTTILGCALFSVFLVPSVHAADADLDAKTLVSLSLEQLTDIEVTSVSKKAEKASEAAAAVFVITQDEIRRSGATSIPEALRMAPGIHVAQAGSHQWAITSRGFTGQFSNKLLVLIDGRTVYTPLFSGVYWDVQDTFMEDIERIEVIRGPGATLWGSNAVNGVINIITKKAKDTHGTVLTARAGNFERLGVGGRYGFNIGEKTHVRAYANYINRDESRRLSGLGSGDEWYKDQAGFRADSENGNNQYTLQGDIYRGRENTIFTLPVGTAPFFTRRNDEFEVSGGNVLGNWRHKIGEGNELTVQAYIDNVQRDSTLYKESRNTFDIDVQHGYTLSERHELTWGLGYRLIQDSIEGTFFVNLTPDDRSDQLYSAFVQDKITLVPEKVFLTLGTKFEHNNYTGNEYQPSARLAWLVTDKQTVWASVSRAVRTPNRSADDVTLPLAASAGPVYIALEGNRASESEEMIAYEMGYRVQPAANLSFDITAFYNDYSRLISATTGTPFLKRSAYSSPYFEVPVYPTNTDDGNSQGIELAANWEVTERWQLSGAYSWLEMDLARAPAVGSSFAGRTPRHQFNVRSTVLLPYNLELNNALYFSDKLERVNINEYYRFDTRLAWKPTNTVELSIVGQNLLDDRHQEFTGFVYQSSAEVPRSGYVNLTLRF